MKIGDVAKLLDISTSKIRYYERQGLIEPPERVSGVRNFGNNTLTRLRFIQLCQAAGFKISEIRSLLEQYAEDSGRTGLWQPAVEIKQNEVLEQIARLQQVDAVLSELLKCRCESIEQCVGLALRHSTWALGEGE